MTHKHQEYLRRNLAVAKAEGTRANLTAALDRLTGLKHAPKWLVELLKRTHENASALPHEIAMWRDAASDAPSRDGTNG